jgi:hypothetical protein
MGRLATMNPGRRRGAPAWLVALLVGLIVGAVGLPAGAVETPVGSKNFTTPSYAPDYFTNESGALTGATGARGGRWRAPVYAAPRVYPGFSHRYAAERHRYVRRRGHTLSRSRYRYRHAAHRRMATHRHFVSRHFVSRHFVSRHFAHVAARGRRRLSPPARPAAAHHRAARRHARSRAHTNRIARAGR